MQHVHFVVHDPINHFLNLPHRQVVTRSIYHQAPPAAVWLVVD